MISAAAIHTATAAVYAVALVGCLWMLQDTTGARQRYLRLATIPIAVGAATSVLLALGAGVVTVNGYELEFPTIASDFVAYPTLWAVTAMLAGVDRRTVAVAAALPFVQVAAFWTSPVYGGLVALTSFVVVVGSHLLIAAVFRGRIWAASGSVPEERRLLHWKARNLLLFLIGMLIAFAFLSVAGAFDDFGTLVLDKYVSVLIRVGFAGFLFANVGALGDAADAAQTGDTGPGATAVGAGGDAD